MGYWELSPRERAELTEEQVRDLEKYELMRNGVVRAEPPGPKPTMPRLLSATMFKVTYQAGWENTLPVLFCSAAEAYSFISDNPTVQATVRVGAAFDFDAPSHECAVPLQELDPKVEEAVFPDRSTVLEHRATLERHGALLKEWEESAKVYNAAVKAEREAVAGMWSDWTKGRRVLALYLRIKSTWEEYVELAGDVGVAMSFLSKAFDASEIARADDWLGFLPERDTVEEKGS